MNKKLITAAGAGAILLGMAVPVLGHPGMGSDDVVTRNRARVYTSVATVANTGVNRLGAMCLGGGVIRTGRADAWTDVQTDVNFTAVECPGCGGDVMTHNKARVGTRVLTVANTGLNSMGGMMVRGGRIISGDAVATSVVANTVNTTVVGGAW